MRRIIPAPLISVIADLTSSRETHASLDSLFHYANAPGDPPDGSKHVKALEWLRRTNKDQSVKYPLSVAGRLIEGYMELSPEDSYSWGGHNEKDIERLKRILESCDLKYINGGTITSALAKPSVSLSDMIRSANLTEINNEFERAQINVDKSPRDSISAACNIIESICKIYIEDENLEMPRKKDIKSLWAVVRKDLGFDPSEVEDRDLQEILSGMISVVGGIGSLRTHASTAHGAGRKRYKVEGRHARLTVHSAHTISLFILESWDKKKETRSS